MGLTLNIEKQDYVLLSEQDGNSVELSRMTNGAQRLLPGTGVPTEALLEAAIETAENCLMPYASRQQGQVLEVKDPTGRLATGLLVVMETAKQIWSIADIEEGFLELVDLTTGRSVPAALIEHRLFVADWLLVREFAHHGQFAQVRFSSN